MTVNKEEESEKETNAALAVEIPTDSPPMYCVKTLQETSASVFRMVSVSFVWICTTLIFLHLQWAICLTYLLPNFACGLVMTFSVTGLPFYQSEDITDGSARATPTLDEDQGSWFGMSYKG